MFKTLGNRVSQCCAIALFVVALPVSQLAHAASATRGWVYDSSEGSNTAMVKADDGVDVGAPYGKQGVYLAIWHKDGDYFVTVSLEKGQFKCANHCMVGVGSDSDDPIILHGSMPSEDSGNTLFLTGSDASRLVSMLINAKKLLVLTSYASGNKVAVFDASGFDLTRL